MNRTTSIFYALYKNNELKGYLLGSLHMLFNPQDYENKKNGLAPYFDTCKTFIFEADTQILYTQFPFGTERAAYELLESKQNKSIEYLESFSFQRAMLGVRIFFGSSIIRFPWNSYNLLNNYSNPIIFANRICSFFAILYNTAYNLIFYQKHSYAVHQFQKKQQEKTTQFFKDYQQEIFSEIAQEDQKYLYISERHNSWMEKLRYSDDLEGPFFITVGVAHLPGERGLVKLLEGEGYELVPQKLHSKDKKEQSLIMDQ